MEIRPAERQLRAFLLWLAGFICAGTAAELLLAEHYESATQLIPFALCAAGVAAVGAVLARPGRTSLLALRVVMALLVAGSLMGVYEHLEGNIAFELEIRPGAAAGDVLLKGLRGAAPLLAPGILALAGVIATAATHEHPALPARRRAAGAKATRP